MKELDPLMNKFTTLPYWKLLNNKFDETLT